MEEWRRGRTLFLRIIPNHFVILGKISSEFALEAGRLLRTQFAARWAGGGACVSHCHCWLQAIQLVSDAIDHLLFMFREPMVVACRRRRGSASASSSASGSTSRRRG